MEKKVLIVGVLYAFFISSEHMSVVSDFGGIWN